MKVLMVLFMVVTGKPPISHAIEVPSLEVCWTKAAELLATAPKDDKDLKAVGVGCQIVYGDPA